MGASSSSQYLRCSEDDLIIQMAKSFKNNAPALGPSSCLVLDTPVCARILRCLPPQPELLADDEDVTDYVSASFSFAAGPVSEHAKILDTAISKAENLELVHNDATIEGQLDLSRFHSLLQLRLKSVPIHLLLNLSKRRDTLVTLDVDLCAATLMSVIELCAGDRTTGANWPRLKNLRFSGCRIKHLDLSLRYVESLTNLDLSYNQLVRVDELQHLKSLQSLNLSYNRLHRLPSLAPLRNLRLLRLSYNFLESLAGLEDLKRLERLDARNNVICHLAIVGDLRRLTRLLSLDLRGNPAAAAPDHRAQLLLLLNCREPNRLLLNGRRLSSDEVRRLVHVMKAYPRSASTDESHQHQPGRQQQLLARGSVNAGYSTADDESLPVALVHVDADANEEEANVDERRQFVDSCDISGDAGLLITGARTSNFTNECEADVSSADEPIDQQRFDGTRHRASPAAGQSMREYLAGLRQRYGDGYIVRLNEQQRQQRQLRQPQQEEPQLDAIRQSGEQLLEAASGGSPPTAVASTPLDPPPTPPPILLRKPQLPPTVASVDNRTPVMDSVGSDLFLAPPLPPPPPPAQSVEQELGLIRGHQFLATIPEQQEQEQPAATVGVMLALADQQLTVRRLDGKVAEQFDLARLVNCELPSKSADGLLRLRFSTPDRQVFAERSFRLQEDDPADVAQLESLLSPYIAAAAATVDRFSCARCEHSFDAAEASRSILPCESAHSLSDIREASVCPRCRSEFILAANAVAAAAPPAASLAVPSARFFVGSVGTDLSAPRVSPPSVLASPSVSPAGASAGVASVAAAFAHTPSMVSVNTQQDGPPAGSAAASAIDIVDVGTDDPDGDQSRQGVEEDSGTFQSPAAAAELTDADATGSSAEPVSAVDDTKEVLGDNWLVFDPAKPEVIDHRLKLHLDLVLLGNGEEANFSVLLARCQLLSGKRGSAWEAKQAVVLVGTTRHLLLLDCCPSAKPDAELSKRLDLLHKWPLASLQAVQLSNFGGGLALLRMAGDAQLLAPLGHRAKLDALADCLRRHCGHPEAAADGNDDGRCWLLSLADTSALALLVLDDASDSDAELLRLLALQAGDVAEALASQRRGGPDWRTSGQVIESASLTSLQCLSVVPGAGKLLAGAPLRLEFFPEDGVASWSVVMATPVARRELCQLLSAPWKLRFGVELPVGSADEWP